MPRSSPPPVVLSAVEATEFFQHVCTIRYRAALDDLRVRQGKGKKDRYAMLSPRLLEVLRRCYEIKRQRRW